MCPQELEDVIEPEQLSKVTAAIASISIAESEMKTVTPKAAALFLKNKSDFVRNSGAVVAIANNDGKPRTETATTTNAKNSLSILLLQHLCRISRINRPIIECAPRNGSV